MIVPAIGLAAESVTTPMIQEEGDGTREDLIQEALGQEVPGIVRRRIRWLKHWTPMGIT